MCVGGGGGGREGDVATCIIILCSGIGAYGYADMAAVKLAIKMSPRDGNSLFLTCIRFKGKSTQHQKAQSFVMRMRSSIITHLGAATFQETYHWMIGSKNK